MSITLIIFLILGTTSYWVVKVPAVINGTSPVSNLKEFFLANSKEIFFSAIGVLLVIFGGDSIPDAIGKVTNPLTAFTVGGSIPSMSMNISGLFNKK